jgi:uncharacterized repeat protein (TIGR03803 family)
VVYPRTFANFTSIAQAPQGGAERRRIMSFNQTSIFSFLLDGSATRLGACKHAIHFMRETQMKHHTCSKSIQHFERKVRDAMGHKFVFSAILALLIGAVAVIPSPAQTFKTLVSFDYSNGAEPYFMNLVQGLDGNLYGTTYSGGIGYGTVFKITTGGKLTVVHSFELTDGAHPAAGLVLATDGNFYGTTYDGGSNSQGTIFKITPSGTLTTLYNFCAAAHCTDGSTPYAGLVQGTDGNFYGTTYGGGSSGNGTVFKVTPEGKLTTLHNFCSQPSCADGHGPYAGLVQAVDGNFYGTTVAGGPYGDGTVFTVAPTGTLTTIHSFKGTDGSTPYGGLVQATNGNFYGTTYKGGIGFGTVFTITPGGKLTTLHSFDGSDGSDPYGGVLVQGTDGNFYGTTYVGGANDDGTVFKITASGTLTTLHSFDRTDGAYPYGGLVQATNGSFYGTTYEYGANVDGTIFSLSVGLGPFVKTLPTFGKEGATIFILGTNLTGATKVSFNGTAAKFKVVSGSEITTTVPAGAKTGSVEVTTPSGTLKSNVVFYVTPQITSFTPTSGVLGTSVTIMGTELTQTTEITFGGVKATTITVNSDSEVTADVPKGAKTGKIAVTTPGGTATSSGTFTVTP